MSDYISRRAAIKAIDDLPNCYNGYSDTYDKAYIIGVLEEVPTAQPEPKRGKWIHDGSKWTNRWICSECGYKWFFDCIEGAYCPNCGADMRGEQDG